ncbi:hypothetical protein [Lactiplantibacillus pingfangensis]|nr:hypothetical protein [Lactiplantibacillus pingfangensis]
MTNSSDELLSYWTTFKKYDEYPDFNGYPTTALKESLRFFGGVMTEITQ